MARLFRRCCQCRPARFRPVGDKQQQVISRLYCDTRREAEIIADQGQIRHPFHSAISRSSSITRHGERVSFVMEDGSDRVGPRGDGL